MLPALLSDQFTFSPELSPFRPSLKLKPDDRRRVGGGGHQVYAPPRDMIWIRLIFFIFPHLNNLRLDTSDSSTGAVIRNKC